MILRTLTAEFEEIPDGGPEGLGGGRVTLYFGSSEIAVFDTGRVTYMDGRWLDDFVATKLGRLFDMLADYERDERGD